MTALDHIANITVEFGFEIGVAGITYFVLDDATRGELDNATYTLAPATVFADITSGTVASVDIARGRDRELDEYSAGVATIVLNDTDRTFDPANTAGPYYGTLNPNIPIRVKYQNTPLFYGLVEDWRVDYEPGDNLSRVTVTATDAFSILANQEIDTISAAHTGDTPGERIDRVLDLDEVNFGPARSIDTGNSTLGNTTFGENALTYLQRCARAEAGYLYIAADGTLTFLNRLAVLNLAASAVFVDGHSATAGIGYQELGQSSSRDLLYNRVVGASETTATAQEVNDTDSQDAYRIQTLDLGTDLLNSTDAEVATLLDYHLNRFATPELRFTNVTVNTGDLTAAQMGALTALELADIVTVYRTPLNTGSEINRMSLIDGISHSIDAGTWNIDYRLANADNRSFLQLDHATFGELDANRLAF